MLPSWLVSTLLNAAVARSTPLAPAPKPAPPASPLLKLDDSKYDDPPAAPAALKPPSKLADELKPPNSWLCEDTLLVETVAKICSI